MSKVQTARIMSERTSTIRIKRQIVEVISIEEIIDRGDETADPYEIFCRKIEQVAELLGCSESHAEALILSGGGE